MLSINARWWRINIESNSRFTFCRDADGVGPGKGGGDVSKQLGSLFKYTTKDKPLYARPAKLRRLLFRIKKTLSLYQQMLCCKYCVNGFNSCGHNGLSPSSWRLSKKRAQRFNQMKRGSENVALFRHYHKYYNNVYRFNSIFVMCFSLHIL